jgi:hypothetical protein
VPTRLRRTPRGRSDAHVRPPGHPCAGTAQEASHAAGADFATPPPIKTTSRDGAAQALAAPRRGAAQTVPLGAPVGAGADFGLSAAGGEIGSLGAARSLPLDRPRVHCSALKGRQRPRAYGRVARPAVTCHRRAGKLGVLAQHRIPYAPGGRARLGEETGFMRGCALSVAAVAATLLVATPLPGANPAGSGCGAAGSRDDQGGRHRQRLHFPQRQPSGDVHCHPSRVIATDPIAYGRPTGGQTYVDEIRKVTDKPITYLILQPSSLRPHRRWQGLQGCRRTHHRSPARHGAPGPARRSQYRAAR